MILLVLVSKQMRHRFFGSPSHAPFIYPNVLAWSEWDSYLISQSWIVMCL